MTNSINELYDDWKFDSFGKLANSFEEPMNKKDWGTARVYLQFWARISLQFNMHTSYYALNDVVEWVLLVPLILLSLMLLLYVGNSWFCKFWTEPVKAIVLAWLVWLLSNDKIVYSSPKSHFDFQKDCTGEWNIDCVWSTVFKYSWENLKFKKGSTVLKRHFVTINDSAIFPIIDILLFFYLISVIAFYAPF